MSFDMLSLLPWWIWLVGTLGLVGAIALVVGLVIFGPVVAFETAQVIGKKLWALLLWILSYRVGCAFLAAILAGLVVGVGQSWRDAEACEAHIAELQQRAQAEQTQHDEGVAAKIKGEYEPQLDKLNKDYADAKQKADDYAKKLPKAAPGCALGTGPLQLRKRPVKASGPNRS